MQISILGSTGSIGTQTLDVARWHNIDVLALAAGNNIELLKKQIDEFKPSFVSCSPNKMSELAKELPAGVKLLDSAEIIAAQKVNLVVAAISGIAGLKPTLAALKAGNNVALANKEAMVVAGPLVWEAARENNVEIIPMDSEHSAIFQCLVGEQSDYIDELIITASGGPFRLQPKDLSTVTVEQALKHPNWDMGAKVTIDSSTLFNKGLEVLEAHFLFDIPLNKIKTVVHPQSLIHSFVRFKDGNLKAQIGPHDMRVPINYAINYPRRPIVPLKPLPLLGSWELFDVDHLRFPALNMAYRAGEMAGLAPTALNAADEVAVNAFLEKKISYVDIPIIIEKVLDNLDNDELSWSGIDVCDDWARAQANEIIRKLRRAH